MSQIKKFMGHLATVCHASYASRFAGGLTTFQANTFIQYHVTPIKPNFCVFFFDHASTRWCCLCCRPSSPAVPSLSASPPAPSTGWATAASSLDSCWPSPHWPSRRRCAGIFCGGDRPSLEIMGNSASCWPASLSSSVWR